MATRLSFSEVDHVALLARLRLTDDEKKRLTDDLNIILQQFEILQRLPTEGVFPTTHPMPLQNVFREDVLRPSLLRDEILSEAPEATDEFLVVPRVIET